MNSHLRVIVAKKELREKRRIGIRVIVNEAHVSRSSAQMLLNNTMRHVPLDELAAICAWVPCEPGDILRLEPIPGSEAP